MGVFIIWLIFAIVVSIIATKKGRSGFGWFILSCVISPLISIIILLVIGDSDDKEFEESQTMKKRGDVSDNISKKSETDQAIEDLNRYKSLLQLGAISQEEFDAKKAELMPILRQDIDKDETKSTPTMPLVDDPQKEDGPLPAKLEKPATAENEPFMLRYGIMIYIAVIVLLLVGGVIFINTLISRHKTKVQLEQSLKSAPAATNATLSTPKLDLSMFEEEKVEFSSNDKKVIDQFFALYDELMVFKSKSDFTSIGFSPNGKYYKWLQRVQKLNTDANAQILIKLRVVPYDLEGLGLEYVSSKGKETEATKLFQSSIKEARIQYKDLTKEQSTPTTTVKPNKVEDSSQETSLGKWKLSVPGINGQIILEIFKKGSSYYCVENSTHKKLRREGDKYYVVGNEWGEYYRIVNGNLKMGDRQGDLPNDSGWKITKLK